MKHYFGIVVIFIAICYVFFNLDLYRQRFDQVKWQSVYDHSQYCVPDCEFRGNIDDPELYSLAGYHFVKGADPSQINPEVQPLTKYFFGLSILWFGTALPVQLIFGVLSLILLYYLGRHILGDYLALAPPLLLLIDPLFLDQLIRPFVDLSLTFWILLYLTFLSSSRYQAHWWWGAIVLGALSLSKSFSYGILFSLITMVIFYLQKTQDSSRLLLKIFGIALATYLAGYLAFFVRGNSISDFILLHYQILRLYKGYVPEYPKGEIIRLIFSGQWQTWWGDKGLIPSPFYSYAWPLALLAYFGTILTHLRQHHQIRIHLVVITIVLLFISSRLMFPRYLLPALPSLYLVLAYLLHTLLNLLQLSHGRLIRSIPKSQ